MNAISRVLHKKWFWPVAILSGLALGGCASVVIEVVTIVVTAYNCEQGNGCTSLATTIITDAGYTTAAKIVTILTKLDPPASDLANFDASQASAAIQTSNLSLISDGGTSTVTLADESSGAVLGTANFPFVINNGVATFSQPSTVNNWIHSFDTYQGNVIIEPGFNIGTTAPPAGQSGTVTITAQYAGSPYASSKLSILEQQTKPKCPPPGTNCQPQ